MPSSILFQTVLIYSFISYYDTPYGSWQSSESRLIIGPYGPETVRETSSAYPATANGPYVKLPPIPHLNSADYMRSRPSRVIYRGSARERAEEYIRTGNPDEVITGGAGDLHRHRQLRLISQPVRTTQIYVHVTTVIRAWWSNKESPPDSWIEVMFSPKRQETTGVAPFLPIGRWIVLDTLLLSVNLDEVLLVWLQLRRCKQKIYCVGPNFIPRGIDTSPHTSLYWSCHHLTTPISTSTEENQDMSSKFAFRARRLPNWPRYRDMQDVPTGGTKESYSRGHVHTIGKVFCIIWTEPSWIVWKEQVIPHSLDGLIPMSFQGCHLYVLRSGSC